MESPRLKKHLMKPLPFLSVSTGIILLAGLHVHAGDIKVIANSSLATDTISAHELRSVFLEEKNSLGGMHVEPVLERSGAAHEVFLKEFLRESDTELQTYYRGLVVTGRGLMPKALGSDAEVVAYVAETKGAIGYVNAETSTEGVKTLLISSTENGADRQLSSRVEPEYPDTLRQHHIGGTVRLRVAISANGSVEKVELLGGNPILAETAIVAVRQWQYTAGHSRTVKEVSIVFDPNR